MNQRRAAATALRLASGHPDRPMPRPQDGLDAGQEVRWKQQGRSRWRYGHLGDPPVAPDGSLTVYDHDFNGGARALRPGEVQRLVRGPRGGRRWVSCQLDGGPLPPVAGGPVRPTAADRLDRSATATANGRSVRAHEGLGL
jgi:hypothetical protein